MIRGAPLWHDRARYYSQTNNPTEEQLRKAGVRSWLETCGPTAAVNCIAALGYPVDIRCPGPYRPQPEEVLADYFNDPRQYPALQRERLGLLPADIQGNRVPQYYPYAVREVFGAHGQFLDGQTWDSVVELLSTGHAVQICLRSPGHYLAAVAYDDSTEEIIYHDSWPGRVRGDGFALRMAREEFDGNVHPWVIAYRGGN